MCRYFWSVFFCIRIEYKKIGTRKTLIWTLFTQLLNAKAHSVKSSCCIPFNEIFFTLLRSRSIANSNKQLNMPSHITYLNQKRIWNPVNHLRWSVFQKYLTIFAKNSILDRIFDSVLYKSR